MSAKASSTSTLDELLSSPDTRDVVLGALEALREGGGVVTANIKNKPERKRMEAALKEFGARCSKRKGDVWVLKGASSKRVKEEEDAAGTVTASVVESMPSTQRQVALTANQSKPVYGPTTVKTAVALANEEGEEEEEGPALAGSSKARAPVAVSSSAIKPSHEEKTQRGGWMFETVKEEDPMRHLRLEAMTSQKGRTFNNHRTDVDASFLPNAGESRAAATGKVESMRPVTTQSSAGGGFKWNHEEMMSVEKVDKQRLQHVMGEGVNSRFAPASKKFL